MPKKRSRSRRAAVPIRLSMAPPLPITMPFCESRSTKMLARMYSALRSLALGQLLDPHRAGIGHLLMGEPEDLLADGLGHPEGLRLVGERFAREVRRALRQGRDDQLEQPVAVRPRAPPRSGRSRRRGRGPGRRRSAAAASSFGDTRSTLLRQQNTGARQLLSALRIDSSRRPGSSVASATKQTRSTSSQRALRGPRHELAEPARGVVQAGRVHEDDLGARAGAGCR